MVDVRQDCGRLLSRGQPALAALRPPKAGAAAFAFTGAGTLAVLAVLPFSGRTPLIAAALTYAIASGIALAHLPRSHPHPRFGAANTVTLIRLGGVAVFAALAVEPRLVAGSGGWWALALALFLLALDGLDGWLARRQRLASAFGARFDMEVDALLILALAVIAFSQGEVGFWVLGLGLVRYAFVAAGWLWPRLAAPLPPSLRRKSVCVVQVVALTALLAPVVATPVSGLLAATAFAALLWSFAVDVRWLLARP